MKFPVRGGSFARVSIKIEKGRTLSFDQFWDWLLDHPNCILRAGTTDSALYDLDAFHWHFSEEESGAPIIQLVRGKDLVGEIIIDPQDVQFVQVTADNSGAGGEEGGAGRFLFELIGGTEGETFPMYHFLMAHGLEEEVVHQGGLKH